MAKISVSGVGATIRDGKWSCSDRFVSDLLYLPTDPEWLTGYIPQRDNFIAEQVAEKLGGEVVQRDESDDSYIPDRIY